jgi:hypothetical protein
MTTVEMTLGNTPRTANPQTFYNSYPHTVEMQLELCAALL